MTEYPTGKNNNEARPRERSDRDPFLPLGKKPLHNGSYEHRVPKKKTKTLFCTKDVCLCDLTS